MSENSKKYCTFYLDDHYFGIDVHEVQELIPSPAIKPIPHAPPMVRGLINLRGQIVTVIDLRRALGFPTAANLDDSVNVIVHTEEDRTSFLVDRIDEVHELSTRDRESLPDTIAKSFSYMLEGVYKLNDRLLLILNVNRVIGAETMVSATAPSSCEARQPYASSDLN